MKNRPSSPRKKAAGARKPAPARAAAAPRSRRRAAASPRPEPAPPPRAVVRFLAGWTETLEGEVRPGGVLVIDYDPSRLPDCHTTWRGADVWSITAFARFHPGGATAQGPLLEEISDGGLVHGHRPKPLELRVPEDAERVELWFYSSYQLSSACEAWDSRYGQNYWFDVARAETSGGSGQ